MHVREEINEAYEYIRKRTHYTPAIGIILGPDIISLLI